MSVILTYSKFFEANLTLDELDKNIDGEKRGDVLIKKIRDHDSIKKSDNSFVRIDKMVDGDSWVDPEVALGNITDDGTPDGDYDSSKGMKYFKKTPTKFGRFKKVFKDDSGDEFELSKISKTKEFGSSGAGRDTKKLESLQAIFIGLKLLNPDLMLTTNRSMRLLDVSIGDLAETVKIPERIESYMDIISEISRDKEWLETLVSIPNKLWSGFPTHRGKDGGMVYRSFLDDTLKYVVYHTAYIGVDSPYVHIKKKFKEVSKIYKDNKELDKDLSFDDINISKWCPADVYLMADKYSSDILSEIDSCTSIVELNTVMDKHFDAGFLIPLSLKKVGKKFTIITNREIDKELPEFKIVDFKVGKELRGIGSKISVRSEWRFRNKKKVEDKDRTITIDSSDTSRLQNVDLEVEGSHSRHGKVNFRAIKRMIGTSVEGNKFKLDDCRELSNNTISDLKNIFNNLLGSISEMPSDIIKIVDINRGSDISNSKNKLISRIQSMQLVLCLSNIEMENPKLSSEIITKIMRYALSIQTDKFDTPRYLRVI